MNDLYIATNFARTERICEGRLGVDGFQQDGWITAVRVWRLSDLVIYAGGREVSILNRPSGSVRMPGSSRVQTGRQLMTPNLRTCGQQDTVSENDDLPRDVLQNVDPKGYCTGPLTSGKITIILYTVSLQRCQILFKYERVSIRQFYIIKLNK